MRTTRTEPKKLAVWAAPPREAGWIWANHHWCPVLIIILGASHVLFPGPPRTVWCPTWNGCWSHETKRLQDFVWNNLVEILLTATRMDVFYEHVSERELRLVASSVNSQIVANRSKTTDCTVHILSKRRVYTQKHVHCNFGSQAKWGQLHSHGIKWALLKTGTIKTINVCKCSQRPKKSPRANGSSQWVPNGSKTFAAAIVGYSTRPQGWGGAGC